MPRISCAIVEDDFISLKVIEGMAEKTGMLHVEASFTSPLEAVQWLSANPIDLLFLDMEMPDLTGLELLRSLVHKPAVIIISGNPAFAVDAFEFSVTDFLLKPLKDYSRFLMAVNKVVDKEKKNSSPVDNNLYVKVDSLLLKVNTDDIFWIEASGDYIKIQTTDKVHTIYSTLKKIGSRLPDHKFVRVHRSFIVNLSKITNIDPNNLEVNKKIIPISGSYKEDLLNKIQVL
jgi:DNA-binding LytR/AlgR family response regulator